MMKRTILFVAIAGVSAFSFADRASANYVSLTATPPTGYGVQYTAPNGNAQFTPGTSSSTAITTGATPGSARVNVTNPSPETFYLQINGFSTTAPPPEIFELTLSPSPYDGPFTPTDLTNIVTEINSQSTTDGVIASLPTLSGYSTANTIQLTQNPVVFPSPADGTSYLGINFSTLPPDANSDSISVLDVTAIASVPEPTTAALILIAGGGLLLRRRRQQPSV